MQMTANGRQHHDRQAKKTFEELAHQWRYLARQIDEL
jgi:hypothetical protein